MGTNANVYFWDNECEYEERKLPNENPRHVHVGDEWTIYPSIYHHYDGYESHLGNKLAESLLRMTTHTPRKRGEWNRTLGAGHFDFGCVVATIIAQLKTEPGNVYVYPPDHMGRKEYEYTISHDRYCHTLDVPWMMTVHHRGNEVFQGTPEEFLRKHGPDVLARLEEEMSGDYVEARA